MRFLYLARLIWKWIWLRSYILKYNNINICQVNCIHFIVNIWTPENNKPLNISAKIRHYGQNNVKEKILKILYTNLQARSDTIKASKSLWHTVTQKTSHNHFAAVALNTTYIFIPGLNLSSLAASSVIKATKFISPIDRVTLIWLPLQ